ncbi:MAG: GerMN domain-containing protein [Desulfuromonadaceae bacterium]|nr:GerMN domain-containing protein [Desulfuromonadaceae bacterium]
MPARRQKKITISILVPFLVFTLFFSIMIWQKYRSSQEVPVAPPQQNAKGYRSVTLFFAEDGTHLAREAREIGNCDDDNACLKSVLHELLNGPVGELEGTLPDGAAVNTARIEGTQATIDFNRTFSDAMLSGSSAEMLAVYSVVDTVAVNFPQVQTVKLDVDGNSGVILHHLDLSEPLPPDYSLEQPPPSEPEDSSTGPVNDRKEGVTR